MLDSYYILLVIINQIMPVRIEQYITSFLRSILVQRFSITLYHEKIINRCKLKSYSRLWSLYRMMVSRWICPLGRWAVG